MGGRWEGGMSPAGVSGWQRPASPRPAKIVIQFTGRNPKRFSALAMPMRNAQTSERDTLGTCSPSGQI